MKKKIIWLLASCLVITAMLLASCAPVTTPTPTPTPTPAPTATPTPTPAPSALETVTVTAVKVDGTVVTKSMEKPRYGGVFVFAFMEPPSGFDEAFIRPTKNYSNRLTGEHLLGGDWSKGPAGTGENSGRYVPFIRNFMTGFLAESWEMPDGQTLVFHIRKGVHFALDPASEASRLVGGREVDANDVVYSIKRLLDTKGSFLQSAHPGGVESLSAPDKWTVVIKCLPGDTGPFLENAAGKGMVVPHEVIEKYGDMRDWKNAVGTGPFILKDYIAQSSLTFIRNPNYWRRDPLIPDNQLPYLDGINFLVVPDTSTRLAALRTGRVDWGAGVFTEDAVSLMKTNPELQSVESIGDATPGTVMPIAWRLDDPKLPFVDIRVRHALLMAIDFNSIIKDYYGGKAVLLSFPGPPLPEFGDIVVPLEKLPPSVQELYSYNPEKAKKLLAEAGYPKGFKTEIVCEARRIDQLSIIKNNWAQIGVDLNLDVKEFAVWTSMYTGRTFKEMIVGSRGIAAPFKMESDRPGATQNYSNSNDLHNEEVYQQVAANYFNEKERDRIFREWLPYALDKAYYFTFPTPYLYTFWWPWLKNYHGEYSIGYTAYFAWTTYVWLDTPLWKTMAGR